MIYDDSNRTGATAVAYVVLNYFRVLALPVGLCMGLYCAAMYLEDILKLRRLAAKVYLDAWRL